MTDSAKVPHRAAYEGAGGWKDGRFGQAYDLIADALKGRGIQELHGNKLLGAIVAEDDNYDGCDPECPASPSGRHQVDTSMESGPNNCFYCERSMK